MRAGVSGPAACRVTQDGLQQGRSAVRARLGKNKPAELSSANTPDQGTVAAREDRALAAGATAVLIAPPVPWLLAVPTATREPERLSDAAGLAAARAAARAGVGAGMGMGMGMGELSITLRARCRLASAWAKPTAGDCSGAERSRNRSRNRGAAGSAVAGGRGALANLAGGAAVATWGDASRRLCAAEFSGAGAAGGRWCRWCRRCRRCFLSCRPGRFTLPHQTNHTGHQHAGEGARGTHAPGAAPRPPRSSRLGCTCGRFGSGTVGRCHDLGAQVRRGLRCGVGRMLQGRAQVGVGLDGLHAVSTCAGR
jgi:hypothetical protein